VEWDSILPIRFSRKRAAFTRKSLAIPCVIISRNSPTISESEETDMQSLSVVFLPSTGSIETVVDHETQFAPEGEHIYWEFSTAGLPAIAEVEIEFENGVGFFPNATPPHRFSKQVVNNQATIWGVVPTTGASAGNKYTIRARNAGNVVIAEFDPKIVTAVP